jgi:hypothetical protein
MMNILDWNIETEASFQLKIRSIVEINLKQLMFSHQILTDAMNKKKIMFLMLEYINNAV